MKIQSILAITISMCLAVACNNNADTTSTSSDTSSGKSELAGSNIKDDSQSVSNQDTSASGKGLMKAMDDMMAKMHAMKMSGDFDIDFANMMAEHHQGAIDMAQVEISHGKDDKMKAKAQEILSKQNDEQSQLEEFVSSYKPSGMKHGEGEMEKSMSGMMEKMKSMQMTGNTDKDFATMMIAHHEDGISMAKMEVKNGMSAKLKQMAKKSITDQQKDISEFKQWLSGNK